MNDTPLFSRDENHKFKDGEKIYIIDDNLFDIWEAEIQSIEEDGYHIHYPEYPSDDCVKESSSQFLVRDEINTKIFKQQDQIRKQKEKKSNKKSKDRNYDMDESESDGDYQQKKKKNQKKKKKENPKKEKKEKKPKEPKPKKEPKQKKANQGKHKKISSENEYIKIKHEIIKTAFRKNIDSTDAFIKFFDETYRPKYGDKQMDKIFDSTFKRFERELLRSQNKDQEGDDIFGDINSTTDDEVSDQNEEEDINFEPEEVILPTTKGKLNDGYEISIANTALSFNKNESFPIIFDDEKRCNAFIYKTPATQYLILNGMKFELEQIDEDESANKFFFYDESKLASHENQQSASYFYPKVKKLGVMRVKESLECIKYMDLLNKKKSKIGQLQWLPELEDGSDSAHNSSKRKSRKNDVEDSRILQIKDIESESD